MRVVVLLLVCAVTILAIFWFFREEKLSSVSSLKRNYKTFLASEDYYRRQLRSTTVTAPVSMLLSDTLHLHSDSVDFKQVFALFLNYPNIHYIVCCPDDVDPLELVRYSGDSFLSLLYSRDTGSFDPSFLIAQRSKFTMQLLFTKAFYTTPLEQIFIDDQRVIATPHLRTYFSFIFLDKLQMPRRKYWIHDRLVQASTKNVFQTWLSHDTDVEFLHRSSECIKRDYPGYSYRLFDDYDMKKFIRHFYPQAVVDRYDSILPSAFKSDFFRYLYLYRIGGMYFDITLISARPITDVVPIDDYDFSAPIDLGSQDVNQLYQAFMYAKKGHPYMKECINTIMDYDIEKLRKETINCLAYTGPRLIGSIVAKDQSGTSKNIYLRHTGGDRVVYDSSPKDEHIIIYTKGKFPEMKVGKAMYKESQKRHYSEHCMMNTIFYNELI